MEIMVYEKRSNGIVDVVDRIGLYRASIKKALHSAVGDALDDETRRATKEIIEQRENAIQQIAEEQRLLIKKIVEDEKKVIWEKVLESAQSEFFDSKTIKERVGQACTIEESIISVGNADRLSAGNKPDNAACEREVTLEILPPRDQNEIAAINDYLNKMPEALKVELITLVDKSVFKVKLSKPVNITETLASLPQVLNTEEIVENGQKKIKIALLAKAKWERDHNKMNEKMNKLFNNKN